MPRACGSTEVEIHLAIHFRVQSNLGTDDMGSQAKVDHFCAALSVDFAIVLIR